MKTDYSLICEQSTKKAMSELGKQHFSIAIPNGSGKYTNNFSNSVLISLYLDVNMEVVSCYKIKMFIKAINQRFAPELLRK